MRRAYKIALIIVCNLFLTGCHSNDNTILLTYGENQHFRYRHNDVNILGHYSSGAVKKSVYHLNGETEIPFYIKGTDPQRDRISRNRLFKEGDFNIEIPVTSANLVGGLNHVLILVKDSSGNQYKKEMQFSWDPQPVPLPLDLSDLSQYDNIQDIGQVVNGVFVLDKKENVIRTQAPVAKDVLLLLGSPHGSQEANYSVIFSDTSGHFVGLSDFFAGHEEASPPIGIKPGWSSAGLATIRPHKNRSAQTWLAWGDLLESDKKWVVKTDPPKPFDIQAGLEYRVRHQVLFDNNINRSRFKIWPSGKTEPQGWLCEENDQDIDSSKIKFRTGSFGLFQLRGQPTKWFDIRVRSLDQY